MGLWQRRGETFGKRSELLRRGEVLQGIMKESLIFLADLEGPILDVGCGDGVPTATLVQRYRVIGVDFASTMLRRAKLDLPSVDLLRASVDRLPLQDNSIPAVTCYFVLSDYDEKIPLLREMQRVLQPKGKLLVADYSSNDDFNNLLDELQKRVLGKGRGMFRLDPYSLSRKAERAGLKVRASKEIHYPLRTALDTFIDQLYLSSAGEEYRERPLTKEQWRELLAEWLDGSEIHVTRRFALILAEKTN